MSKRSPESGKSAAQKKRPKTNQTSMMNFFGSASNPIVLDSDDDDEEKKNDNSMRNDADPARTSKANKRPRKDKKKFHIFCDLDGVLVDFSGGVRKATGKKPEAFAKKQQYMMWAAIARADQFYANLDWMEDGKELWTKLVEAGYCPDVLTGVTNVFRYRQEKFDWCQRELAYAFEDGNGGHKVDFNHVDFCGKKKAHERVGGFKRKGDHVVNVITCWSVNKSYESGPTKVLIDDRMGREGTEWQEAWVAAGGIFIHHTDTESTIRKLIENGILGSAEEKADAVSTFNDNEEVIQLDD